MRLKDQVAIVTGAASGFGAEIARQYIAEGAKVAVADINGAGAQSVAAALGANAIAVTCDVTKRADIDALVKARIARRLTHKALAERMNLAEQQIQRYEATGYAGVSIERLQEAADALNVRVNEVLTLEKE